jgi:hypothetical protein
MPKRPNPNDEDVELCPVPLGREARVLLNDLSRETGKPPLELAGELLVALLEEDAIAHGGVASVPATLN